MSRETTSEPDPTGSNNCRVPWVLSTKTRGKVPHTSTYVLKGMYLKTRLFTKKTSKHVGFGDHGM